MKLTWWHRRRARGSASGQDGCSLSLVIPGLSKPASHRIAVQARAFASSPGAVTNHSGGPRTTFLEACPGWWQTSGGTLRETLLARGEVRLLLLIT
jgi:hypothetical protein